MRLDIALKNFGQNGNDFSWSKLQVKLGKNLSKFEIKVGKIW